jgi:hypothetical protein
MKSVTFPSNGPFTHASLTTIALLVGGELDSRSGHDLQPGRYVIHTRPPGEDSIFSVLPTDTIVIESTQISLYLTTDVPRTRAYSVNNTNTPHVRFPAGTVLISGFADKLVRTQIS